MTDRPHDCIRLRRDQQQWALDKAIRDTGRVFHYQYPGRGKFPESVRMHAMISKHVGKAAQRLERLAGEDAAADHDVTALGLYFDAAIRYSDAQHTIFVNNDEKRALHAASLRCYDEVRARAPYTIEHVDVPWRDTVVSGNLHLAPVEGPAPCVFFIPGCDMTKETVLHPHFNYGAQRGMHVFVFDGPGQGESNLRGIALTTDNYEDAASHALSWLRERPEIDSDRIVLFAMSFGSYWGARFAATDQRLAAAALPWASVCDKYYLMEEESPRYKQLFSYLTQAKTEEDLDRFVEQMDLLPLIGDIACPTLLSVGEYDPRSPLHEVYEVFDRITAPAELWVYADQHHMASLAPSGAMTSWNRDIYPTSFDWLRDRLDGREMVNAGQVLYLEPTGGGPNGPDVAHRRQWFE
jgi:dipeptidyl aminopeptidase/acylaminoacyl peptidase